MSQKSNASTHHITNETIRSTRDTHIYIYSENYYHIGAGQQALIARGEPNTFGVPTCLSYPVTTGGDSPNHLFEDKYYTSNTKTIDSIIRQIEDAFDPSKHGKNLIIFPKIGLGYAKMPEKCPRTYAYLCERLDYLRNKFGITE